MIKHITIDLWLTLIKSHPEYKEQRLIEVRNILRGTIGYNGDPHLLKIAIESVDRFHTMLCEKTGMHNMSQRDLWFMVMYNLGIQQNIALHQIDMIIAKCNELFIEYPPELIDPNTVEILKEIRAMGITIDIISNTGFITGTTLRRTLLNPLLKGIVRAMFFSDATVVAKPSIGMFTNSLNLILTGKGDPLKPGEILHIGDNPIADYNGAIKAGFQALLITGGSEIKLAGVPNYIKQLNS